MIYGFFKGGGCPRAKNLTKSTWIKRRFVAEFHQDLFPDSNPPKQGIMKYMTPKPQNFMVSNFLGRNKPWMLPATFEFVDPLPTMGPMQNECLY